MILGIPLVVLGDIYMGLLPQCQMPIPKALPKLPSVSDHTLNEATSLKNEGYYSGVAKEGKLPSRKWSGDRVVEVLEIVKTEVCSKGKMNTSMGKIIKNALQQFSAHCPITQGRGGRYLAIPEIWPGLHLEGYETALAITWVQMVQLFFSEPPAFLRHYTTRSWLSNGVTLVMIGPAIVEKFGFCQREVSLGSFAGILGLDFRVDCISSYYLAAFPSPILFISTPDLLLFGIFGLDTGLNGCIFPTSYYSRCEQLLDAFQPNARGWYEPVKLHPNC
ncbi:hypothetical protein BKA83DRAFT_4126872 [Pisolithus microcarpus]|nr:hypothetical protein BKA83DRAFT_4126872 [Pisolithus microcarpus]